VIPDRIETGTFMIAAAITGGDIILEGCDASHLDALVMKLKEAGIAITNVEGGLRVQSAPEIKSVDVKTLPYPGFPTDLQAQIMALMAVSRGSSVITETIFENRFMHVAELRRLGANIAVEGHNAVVKGVKKLRGAPSWRRTCEPRPRLSWPACGGRQDDPFPRLPHRPGLPGHREEAHGSGGKHQKGEIKK